MSRSTPAGLAGCACSRPKAVTKAPKAGATDLGDYELLVQVLLLSPKGQGSGGGISQ